MGLFKWLAERKIRKNSILLMRMQLSNYNRFKIEFEKERWDGAAIDARMILEALAHISVEVSRHSQNYIIDFNSNYGRFEAAISEDLNIMALAIADALEQEPSFKAEFDEQMASETSPLRNRMVGVMEMAKEVSYL